MARAKLNFSSVMMESFTQLMVVLVIVMLILETSHHQTEGFNLWTNKTSLMEGPDDSQFGFSVALWSDMNTKKRLVVGSPRSKNSAHLGVNVTNFSLGNIFLCDLDTHCRSHPKLPMVNEKDNSEQALTDGFTMKRYGMGFGQTLSSLKQDKSPLAACAPRYPRWKRLQIESRGACFILDDAQSDPALILPYPRKNPSAKTTQNALMGFSAALINEADPSIVIGGPNAFYGEGVIVNKPLKGRRLSTANRNRNKDNAADRDTAAYEGWQVAQGKFNGSDTQIAVSIVNFGNNTGKVKIYPKTLELVESNEDNYLNEYLGSDVGSKFGYSLGVGDFNGDGIDDLLVGSPLAPVKQPKFLPDAGKVFVFYKPLIKDEDPDVIQGYESWGRFGLSVAGLGDLNRDDYDDVAIAAPYAGTENEGIVYIFNGSPKGLLPKPTQILKASEFPGGMVGFGFSLDGGLDMDDNGYPDLIIGAVDSNKAVFVRSAPVLTLVGSVSFASEEVKVDNKNCTLVSAGYKKRKGACFDVIVDIKYKTHNTSNNINSLDMEFHMLLQDQSDPPQYAFMINGDQQYTRTIEISRSRGNSEKNQRTWVPIFAKSNRSIIGQPVKVSVSVRLPTPSAESDVVPPVLDIISQTTFDTAVILTCENNTTCFSKPDMSISADSQALEVGTDDVSVAVLLQVQNDAAYEVEVTVEHPNPLKYKRVEGDGLIPECKYRQLSALTVFTKFTCRFEFIEADEKVNFTLFFTHEPLEVLNYLGKNKEKSLDIELSVGSDSIDTNQADNTYTAIMKVNTRAILFTSGESRPQLTTVKVNTTLSKEEVQKHDPPFPVNRMGPKIRHVFSLTNRGPSPVKGAKLHFQLALYHGDDRVFYLFEEPITSNLTCNWPTGTLFNPWNLQDPVVDHSRNQQLSNVTETPKDAVSRKRREVEPENPQQDPQNHGVLGLSSDDLRVEGNSKSSQDLNVETATPRENLPPRTARSTGEDTKKITCDQEKCRVTCVLDEILQADTRVSVTISGYLIIAALDQTGYRKVDVESSITAYISQSGSKVVNPISRATTSVTLLKPPESGLSAVPYWLLLVAVLGSIVLILLIILLLWKTGFFKRNRPPTDPKRPSLIREDYPPPQQDLQEIAAMAD